MSKQTHTTLCKIVLLKFFLLFKLNFEFLLYLFYGYK